MAKDPVMSFIGAVVGGVMAPINAAMEVATDGKISDETAETLAKSIAFDSDDEDDD